jgi:1-acyl-sn-glycerol-3-phosphate acyltransferase
VQSNAETGAIGSPHELTQRPVQLRGSVLARVLLRLAGWRIRFDGLPAAQGVAIVFPHTSNWDFVVGILAKWGIGIPVTFWGKDSLFRIPLFGRWVRWLGGVPVDRTNANGIVGAMARSLQAARSEGRFLWLALAPEGTRRYVEGWRSGFYHVALEAQVPLGLVCFDYARREVGFRRFLQLGGDPAADMAAIAQGFGSCTGLNPQLAAPIRLKP